MLHYGSADCSESARGHDFTIMARSTWDAELSNGTPIT